jgi:hypothetical protein
MIIIPCGQGITAGDGFMLNAIVQWWPVMVAWLLLAACLVVALYVGRR